MMRLEAVEKRLLMRDVGFQQHLHFVLLFQLAFPVVHRSSAGQDRPTGSEWFCQHFGGKLLGSGFIGGGTQYNDSVRCIHYSTSSSRKNHYITLSLRALMNRAAERPDFNYF